MVVCFPFCSRKGLFKIFVSPRLNFGFAAKRRFGHSFLTFLPSIVSLLSRDPFVNLTRYGCLTGDSGPAYDRLFPLLSVSTSNLPCVFFHALVLGLIAGELVLVGVQFTPFFSTLPTTNVLSLFFFSSLCPNRD